MRKGFFNIRSPLTIGAISLSLLIILSIATLSIRYVGLVPWASYVVVWLGVTVSLAAIIYPGVLMGFMKAIPFWSGPGPSLLLLSASLLSGSALVALIGGLGHAGLNLSRMMLWLLIMNGLFISIHIFLGNQALKSTRTSVQPLLKGNLYLIFIMGVILVGLVSPFVLFIIGILSSSASMLQVGSVLILIGGILMRYSLIASGVKMSVLSEDSITASYWMDRS